jgi:hypothetical protein
VVGGNGYSVGTPAAATVTIADNDGPATPPVTNPPGDRPADKDECKDGAWKSFGVFKNQGDCVSWFATGGKNPPATPAATNPREDSPADKSADKPADKPADKDRCKDGGWKTFGNFKNQGECVSKSASGGKNPPTG